MNFLLSDEQLEMQATVLRAALDGADGGARRAAFDGSDGRADALWRTLLGRRPILPRQPRAAERAAVLKCVWHSGEQNFRSGRVTSKGPPQCSRTSASRQAQPRLRLRARMKGRRSLPLDAWFSAVRISKPAALTRSRSSASRKTLT